MAADEAPDALIKRLSADVLNTVKSDKAIQAGDLSKVIALVDKTVMPNVNFRRMTAAAVGPGWRQATPEQQKRLQDEFKILLVRTYAGALAQVNDQTRPSRSSPCVQPPKTRTCWSAPKSWAGATPSSSTTASKRLLVMAQAGRSTT